MNNEALNALYPSLAPRPAPPTDHPIERLYDRSPKLFPSEAVDEESPILNDDQLRYTLGRVNLEGSLRRMYSRSPMAYTDETQGLLKKFEKHAKAIGRKYDF